MGLTLGGQSKSDFFIAKKKSDGSGYDITDKLTGTVATTPTIANKALSLETIEKSKPAFQEDGKVKISYDQYDASEDVYKLLDKVAVPTTSSNVKAISLENGNVTGGTAGSDESPVINISYLQYDSITSPTKVFVVISAGSIAATSGSFETGAESYNKPTFEFEGNTFKKDIVIPAALFDSEIVTVTEAETLTAGKGFIRKYFTKAS